MDSFIQSLTAALSAPSGDTATHTALILALTDLEATGPGWPLLVRPETIKSMQTYISKREADGSASGSSYANALNSANEYYRSLLGQDRSDMIWMQKKTVFDLAARIKALNNGG